MQSRIDSLEDENTELKTKLKQAIYSKEKISYDNFLRGLEKVSASSTSLSRPTKIDKNINKQGSDGILNISAIERIRNCEAKDEIEKGKNN